MKKIALTASLALLLVISSTAAFARTAYDEGMEHFNARRYLQAAEAFTSASRQEPSKQIYRYYLANCFVHLDRHDRAVEEYRASYLLDPYSSIAEYCAQALKGYHKPVPALAGTHPEDTAVGRAKSTIRQQARSEKDKRTLIASRSEGEIRAKVDEQIKQIDEQARIDIQKLYDPLIFLPAPRANPLLAMPELLKEKEDQIKLSAKQEKQRIIKEADERSKPFQSWRKDRDANLDEVTANLETQLEQPAGPSGVKLQPHGTGLYVRYYGKGQPSKLPDAHAATARIVGEEAGFDLPSPPPTEKVQADKSSTDVRARILK